MPIVAGECEFTTPRPFEARSARVKLSFTVDPGETAEDVMILVGTVARRQAYMMIQDANVPQPAEQPAPRTRAPRAVPPPQPATVGADSGTVVEVPATSDPFVGGAPVQSAPASAEDLGIVSNKAQPTPVAEITDAILQERINAKVASDAKHTQGVLDLIFFFTKNRLTAIYTVTDQEQRAEFLARLAAL